MHCLGPYSEAPRGPDNPKLDSKCDYTRRPSPTAGSLGCTWHLHLRNTVLLDTLWISAEGSFFSPLLLLSLRLEPLHLLHMHNLIYFTPRSLCLLACLLVALMNDFWDEVLLWWGHTGGLRITLLLMIIKRTICAKPRGCLLLSPHTELTFHLLLFWNIAKNNKKKEKAFLFRWKACN